MKKTIKQRFFLSLCLLMLFSLFGGGNLAWAQGTTVTYKVSSTSAVTTSGTAPSGSSATFKNTYSTKDQLTGGNSMTLTLSGYAGQKITGLTLSMKSNKSGGAGYLDVNAGTKQLAAIGSPSSGVSFSNAAWHGSWSTSYVNVEVSLLDNTYIIQDGEKVVIVIGATANSLYCQSFKLTYEAGDSNPSITTSISELLFDNVETSSSKQLSFTLSGRNLTEDATLSIGGTDAKYFSVLPPTSVSPTDGTIEGANVTVKYAPTAVGAHTATLQIKSGETIKEIALSGTGIDPLPIYNVSWMVDEASYTAGTPSTSVKKGERVTALPTEPAAIGIKKFVGWTDAPIAEAQPAAPAVLFTTPENAPAVTGDVTYYAVFATSSAWKRIKALADITVGSYVIKNANYILPNAANSKDAPIVVAAPAIDDKTETITGEVDASMIWSFTTTGTANQFYVKNADGSYLYEINENNGIRVGSTSDKWTFAVNTTDYFSMKGANKSRYCATYKAQDWRSYTSATHENYNNGGKLELYKLTYSDYCTTIPVQLAVGATGYATLYYSNYDLVVPENTEAYTFRSSNGALMKSKTYAAGEVIPAGEAVVVHTLNGLSSTLNFKKGIATVDCDARSQLAGTDEETKIASDEAYYFYGLSLNSSNDLNSVGFYWMEADGAAFTNGAHKAYLKIPTSEFEGAQSVRSFAFKGTTTGVESVESSNNAPQAIYDLTGRRVSKAEKGIYIINGKKVIK